MRSGAIFGVPRLDRGGINLSEPPPQLTPVKAIGAYCLSRCTTKGRKRLRAGVWQTRGWLVTSCGQADCPLYPYRRGHNPNRAGIGGRRPAGSR